MSTGSSAPSVTGPIPDPNEISHPVPAMSPPQSKNPVLQPLCSQVVPLQLATRFFPAKHGVQPVAEHPNAGSSIFSQVPLQFFSPVTQLTSGASFLSPSFASP